MNSKGSHQSLICGGHIARYDRFSILNICTPNPSPSPSVSIVENTCFHRCRMFISNNQYITIYSRPHVDALYPWGRFHVGFPCKSTYYFLYHNYVYSFEMKYRPKNQEYYYTPETFNVKFYHSTQILKFLLHTFLVN